MKIFKKISAWLANPKWYFLLPIILIAVGSTIGATLFLTQEKLFKYAVWGYVFLGIMAVTLSYSIFGVIRIYPDAKERLLKWTEKHPKIDKIVSQYDFTTLVATAGSLIISIAFAIYNGSIAIVLKSIWFGALSAYYIVLILLRGSILLYHKKIGTAVKNGEAETQILINDGKLYQTCGILLLLLPLCLSFAILQMVRAGDSFEHTGITIYVYAIYAFFKIITAVYSFIKERHNPLLPIMATKNIKLADAMVSILALQTAMFREFSGDFSDKTVQIMNAVTGAVVCALTVAIGVYMIVKANLRIKKMKQEQNDI